MRTILTMPVAPDLSQGTLFSVLTAAHAEQLQVSQGVYLINSPATGTPQRWGLRPWENAMRVGYIMVPEMVDADKFFITVDLLPDELPPLPPEAASTFGTVQGRRIDLYRISQGWSSKSPVDALGLGRAAPTLSTYLARRECFTAHEAANIALGLRTNDPTKVHLERLLLINAISEMSKEQPEYFAHTGGSLMVHPAALPEIRTLAKTIVIPEQMRIA